jgi:hypothetical protein
MAFSILSADQEKQALHCLAETCRGRRRPNYSNDVGIHGIRNYSKLPREIVFGNRRSASLGKELLNFFYHFDETVDLGFSVIEIKARAGGGFHTQAVHERLRAMVAARRATPA